MDNSKGKDTSQKVPKHQQVFQPQQNLVKLVKYVNIIDDHNYIDNFRFKLRNNLNEFLYESDFNERLIEQLQKIDKYNQPNWLFQFNRAYRICTHLLHTWFPSIHLTDILDMCETSKIIESDKSSWHYNDLTLSIVFGLLGFRNIDRKYVVVEKIQTVLLRYIDKQSKYLPIVKNTLEREACYTNPSERCEGDFFDFEYPTGFIDSDGNIDEWGKIVLKDYIKQLYANENFVSLDMDEIRHIVYAFPNLLRDYLLDALKENRSKCFPNTTYNLMEQGDIEKIKNELTIGFNALNCGEFGIKKYLEADGQKDKIVAKQDNLNIKQNTESNVKPEGNDFQRAKVNKIEAIKESIISTYNKFTLIKKEFSIFYLVIKSKIDKKATMDNVLNYISHSGIPEEKIPSKSSLKVLQTCQPYPNWNIQEANLDEMARYNSIAEYFLSEYEKLTK